MSLTKPILLQMPSFDATKNMTFKFNVEAGGAQIVANKLTIRDQSSNAVVYDAKQETFKYEHILPANTLQNGKYYNAVVTVFDNSGEESAPSRPIQFRCYTTPTIEFTNIPATYNINNSSFNFMFKYNQNEGERLSDYTVNLYDAFQRLASTSGVVYVPDGTPPFEASYLFTGFLDNTAYYVEVVGSTINGASVSSGKISFNVDYEQPDLFTLLELEDNCDEGYITVASNIVLIDGTAQPDPPTFIDDKEIDLTQDGSYVEWDKGYRVDGDFLARIWFRDPKDFASIAQFSTADGKTITVDFMKGYEDNLAPDMKHYVQITISSIEGMEYFIVSNYVVPVQRYFMQLERIGDLYQVELKEVL